MPRLMLAPYSAALWAAALLSFVTATAAWRRRRGAPGGTYFALMMFGVVIWSAMSALESDAVELWTKIVFSKLEYVGIASVAPLFLRFSMAYGGREKRFGVVENVVLWTIPAATLLLVFTNEWHHLVWTDMTRVASLGGAVFLYGHGAWYWIWVIYYGAVSLAALAVLVQSAFQYRMLYVWQSVIFLAAVALPWIGEVLYLMRIVRVAGLDLATIGFAVAGALVLFGTARLALFDLVPVARTVLVERMSEGVIVLDRRDRVVDINPAAEALLRIETDVVGRSGREILPVLHGLALDGSVAGRERRAVVHLEGTPPLVLELVITVLKDPHGTMTGRLVVLRDSTIREKLVSELQTALADIRTLRGLLPICSSCKKIRDDQGDWRDVEEYVQSHSEAHFTHGMCDECIRRLYPDLRDGSELKDD